MCTIIPGNTIDKFDHVTGPWNIMEYYSNENCGNFTSICYHHKQTDIPYCIIVMQTVGYVQNHDTRNILSCYPKSHFEEQ